MTSDATGIDWTVHQLEGEYQIWLGKLPSDIAFDSSQFEQLWSLHPEEFPDIRIHGRTVKTPRWQEIYGADYYYTGRKHAAAQLPPLLDPLVAWAQAAIDPRLNGIVVNWYDGSLGHYIGPHRDSRQNMIVGAPIVMISAGETRTLRMRPWKQSAPRLDFPVANAAVALLPYATNLAWTHEIPRSACCQGRRVSITLRGFAT
jgi:alkylated DNA repair dioxygenase AlkB